MPYRYDPKTGEYVYDDPLETAEAPTRAPIIDQYGVNPEELLVKQLQTGRDQQFKEQMDQAATVEPDRPLIASGPGQAVSEIGKVAANAGVSLLTDYGDIIAGLGDLAGETFDFARGKGFETDNLFNDADNPWTTWRRNTFAPETEIGKQVNTVVRIGVALATLPKLVFKGAALPFKVAGKAKFLGAAAEASGGLGNFIVKAEDFLKGVGKTDEVTDLTKSMDALGKSFIKGSPAAKAASSVARNDWLVMPLSEVAKATAGADDLKGFANWADSAQQGLRGFTQLAGKGSAAQKIRTVGQALAWDAFVSFNVFGEGDREMDATLSDSMFDMGLPVIPGLMTEAEDSNWARKTKQMVEGLAMGAALNGLIDTYRTYKFAQAFKKAKPTEQAQILSAFGASAQDIGDSLGRQLAAGIDAESPVQQWLAVKEGKASFIDPTKAAYTSPPKSVFGIDDLLRYQQARQQQAAAAMPPPGIEGAFTSPDPMSPVQAALGAKAGAASPINPDDARYATWLGQPGGPPSAPGPLASPSGPAGAPGPGALPGVDTPQALSGAQGAGFLPGGPEAKPPGAGPAGLLGAGGPPVDGRIDPVNVFDPSRPIEGQTALPPGSSPEAKPPGAGPAGLLGAGGPPAGIPPISPVKVEDLGAATPRPPAAVVTPQTIRSGFERDAWRVWKDAASMTFVDSGDGVMRSLGALTEGVRQLMPKTRVDALEYLTTFPVSRNSLGVIPASDSIWTNFISQRALSEGWGRVNPETFEMTFNRKLAYEIDRGEAVTKQAQALDEFDALQNFGKDPVPVDIPESFNAAQQENPLPIDAEQSARVAAAETDPIAAYDQWEARQGQRDTAEQAVAAADQVDSLDAREATRLTAAEKMRLTGKEDPAVIVREMLGLNLDEQVSATVTKAETSRGWNVIDRNGEQLNPTRFPTKQKADQFAEKENVRFRDELTSRARQILRDGQDVPVSNDVAMQIDNTVTGKLNITEAQGNAIRGALPELQKMMDDAWIASRNSGDSGFYNVNDMLPMKRTFELTQQQMQGLADVLQKRIDAGEVTGSALRSIRAVIEKIDRQMVELTPLARAQKAVDDLLSNVDQFGKHGEFCDYL
jgi:hypothetical protein